MDRHIHPTVGERRRHQLAAVLVILFAGSLSVAFLVLASTLPTYHPKQDDNLPRVNTPTTSSTQPISNGSVTSSNANASSSTSVATLSYKDRMIELITRGTYKWDIKNPTEPQGGATITLRAKCSDMQEFTLPNYVTLNEASGDTIVTEFQYKGLQARLLQDGWKVCGTENPGPSMVATTYRKDGKLLYVNFNAARAQSTNSLYVEFEY